MKLSLLFQYMQYLVNNKGGVDKKMGSVTFHGFNYTWYDSYTWTTAMEFTIDFSGLTYGTYDIKYFYHLPGYSDDGHWANLNFWWDGSHNNVDFLFSTVLWADSAYVFDFELFHKIEGSDP